MKRARGRRYARWRHWGWRLSLLGIIALTLTTMSPMARYVGSDVTRPLVGPVDQPLVSGALLPTVTAIPSPSPDPSLYSTANAEQPATLSPTGLADHSAEARVLEPDGVDAISPRVTASHTHGAAVTDGPEATPTAKADTREQIERVSRYTRGGIDFDNGMPLSMIYPASLNGQETVRFDGLTLLVADATGDNYARFATNYNQLGFAYPEIHTGSFVMTWHAGSLATTRRPLEAEPLREVLEGNLRRPVVFETIQARLEALIGRHMIFEQQGVSTRFAITQAVRMSAADVETYMYRPMELSELLAPLADTENSFLFFFCSGRQPDEPAELFPGRYVLVLEYVP